MEEEFEEEAPPTVAKVRGRHIKKRALKNKALSVSFSEKDLKDFVSGFHKRKKKRRKEAQKKQEEALRRKRIEERKKRKLERELALYGAAPLRTGSELDESDGDHEEDKGELIASIAGTTTYNNSNMTITVTTSDISREEETLAGENIRPTIPMPKLAEANKKHNLPVSRNKSFKKVAKHKTRPKPLKKRDKKKGKKKNRKAH
ncbi:hypothetical protein SLEP1_g52937 [Rubroshorea leprosula]|uniref:Nucleolar protein 12 n=1 Tax=Rubroshorea leprosula TaxID=152421 RepID=A0AAV5MAK8_9ROSI|nr:hypothetical protein SLEP1_g52937 [Rubroshorea leprosula]